MIVELHADGTVTIADRRDAVIPRDARRTAVKHILQAAGEHYDVIVAAWERMHR